MEIVKHSKYIIEINNFWSKEKCSEFIAKSESMNYEPATVLTDKGPIRVEHIRNNHRILFTDIKLATNIWQQAKNAIPIKIGNSYAIGLNEMFRFYKYEKGQEFKKHRDQSYIRNELEASYYTFMIYLNDNFEGGATTFNDIKIQPKQGSALIFFHDLKHSGEEIANGVKYILRTDAMFKVEV